MNGSEVRTMSMSCSCLMYNWSFYCARGYAWSYSRDLAMVVFNLYRRPIIVPPTASSASAVSHLYPCRRLYANFFMSGLNFFGGSGAGFFTTCLSSRKLAQLERIQFRLPCCEPGVVGLLSVILVFRFWGFPWFENFPNFTNFTNFGDKFKILLFSTMDTLLGNLRHLGNLSSALLEIRTTSIVEEYIEHAILKSTLE